MYKSQIDLSIEYIEKHISQPLTVELLAKISGYSVDHYAHSFRQKTGLSVADYIRRQRLALAASNFLDGASITESALKYGFSTASGFTKAFKKYYGMSPQQYKNRYFKDPRLTFQTLPELKSVVYLLTPPDASLTLSEAGAYWCGKDFSFSNIEPEDWAKLLDPNVGEIGAWIPSDSSPTGKVYALGPIVSDTSYVPEHMYVITLPAATYAVFEVPRHILYTELKRNIISLWNRLYEKWFASGELQYADEKIAFELYRGEDTYIYVPIIHK